MHNRLPELVGNSESDYVEEVEEVSVGLPYVPETDNSDSSGDSDSGEPSPDDQDGAGEDDSPAIVLCPSVTYTGCTACSGPVTLALLGTPDALTVIENLIRTEKANLICSACAAELDPLNL